MLSQVKASGAGQRLRSLARFAAEARQDRQGRKTGKHKGKAGADEARRGEASRALSALALRRGPRGGGRSGSDGVGLALRRGSGLGLGLGLGRSLGLVLGLGLSLVPGVLLLDHGDGLGNLLVDLGVAGLGQNPAALGLGLAVVGPLEDLRGGQGLFDDGAGAGVVVPSLGEVGVDLLLCRGDGRVLEVEELVVDGFVEHALAVVEGIRCAFGLFVGPLDLGRRRPWLGLLLEDVVGVDEPCVGIEGVVVALLGLLNLLGEGCGGVDDRVRNLWRTRVVS